MPVNSFATTYGVSKTVAIFAFAALCAHFGVPNDGNVKMSSNGSRLPVVNGGIHYPDTFDFVVGGKRVTTFRAFSVGSTVHICPYTPRVHDAPTKVLWVGFDADGAVDDCGVADA